MTLFKIKLAKIVSIFVVLTIHTFWTTGALSGGRFLLKFSGSFLKRVSFSPPWRDVQSFFFPICTFPNVLWNANWLVMHYSLLEVKIFLDWSIIFFPLPTVTFIPISDWHYRTESWHQGSALHLRRRLGSHLFSWRSFFCACHPTTGRMSFSLIFGVVKWSGFFQLSYKKLVFISKL